MFNERGASQLPLQEGSKSLRDGVVFHRGASRGAHSRMLAKGGARVECGEEKTGTFYITRQHEAVGMR